MFGLFQPDTYYVWDTTLQLFYCRYDNSTGRLHNSGQKYNQTGARNTSRNSVLYPDGSPKWQVMLDGGVGESLAIETDDTKYIGSGHAISN